MRDYLAVCEQAARAGGAELMSWRGRFKVRQKGYADPVTDADLASQQTIQRILHEAFPDHDFLGEEDPHGRIADGRHRWILDPLDGTQNYVHGLPNFCVSLALEHDGQLLAGCIFDPTSGDCYTAKQGGGAWLNGEKAQVSTAGRLADALVAISLPPQVNRHSPELKNAIEISLSAQGMRRFGSSALNLAFVAAGRLDAFFATETYVWDVAAGLLLVQEAGGCATAPGGGPIDLRRPQFVAAGTPELNAELRSRLTLS